MHNVVLNPLLYLWTLLRTLHTYSNILDELYPLLKLYLPMSLPLITSAVVLFAQPLSPIKFSKLGHFQFNFYKLGKKQFIKSLKRHLSVLSTGTKLTLTKN